MKWNRPHQNRWRTAITVLIIFGVVGLVGTIWWTRHYYANNLRPVSANQQTTSVTIPRGYTLKQTATLLKSHQIIRNALVFEQYVRNVNAAVDINAGTYDLSPSYSVQEIVSILTEGKVKTNLVTILPGQSLADIKKAFLNAGFEAADVDQAFQPQQYANHPALVDKPAAASLEGYLYPESFQKTADTKASAIVTSALDEMQKRLTPELRAAIAKQGLSVYDAIKLASIVENEVSQSGDRTQVAQVFLRRLREGRKLESDATAKYGAVLAGQAPSLTFSSAYNTYEHVGLPPTPISNVSESALQAVAYPANTDWLYFVSGDDGKTYFSHTLAEHEALTQAHCKKLCSTQ
jgi:UPF0755 protein